MTTADETTPPGLSSAADEPRSSAPWLKAIADAEKAFKDYQDKADNIDKQFANLARLANTTRDREMQLFWANICVLAPSVYSRPPIPVVVPRWKQRDELSRTSCEILERSLIVTFEKEDIDGVMRLVRDDLVILARGVPWLRLSLDGACIDHADRKDWLCQNARNWKENDWVAKRSWLTKEAAVARFGDVAKDLDYAVRKDAKSESDDGEEKAGIWELWCKSQNLVVWVAEGCDTTLDQDPPHLKLEGFFPCPRPAFGTLERRTLKPVPDMVFYKDQLEEINDITARVGALNEAIILRGFYPAGAGDVGDAIETAVKSTTKNQMLVPVSNWAMLGQGGVKDMVIWWPLEIVTTAITALIALRKELISDVYQITGLSDIMRGETEASETLGAQQLKSNYGQIRIKDKQDELTRVARDITRLTGEIIAEHYDGKRLMEMTQMRLPSDAEIEAQAKPLAAQLATLQKELPVLQAQMAQLQQEIQAASQDPEVQQMAKEQPEQAQQVIGQVQQQMQADQQKAQAMQQQAVQLQQQLQKLAATVTIDKVVALLKAEKLRPFILDIETDSTIAPDEAATKKAANEFVTAVGGYLKNALLLTEQMPQAAPMVAETLKFITGQYRAGRELEGVIDEFADQMEQKAQQPPPPNPEALKAQVDAAETQAKTKRDDATAAADVESKKAQAAKDQAEAQDTAAAAQAKALEADTAAKDAELKRRIDLAREQDAQAARKQELELKAVAAALDTENKKATTALEIAHKQAAHEQATEKGVLDIAKTKLEIAAKQQAMDQAAEQHAQGLEQGAQQHKQGMEKEATATAASSAQKEAHDVKPHLEEMKSGLEAILKTYAEHAKQAEAPIEILYGPDGKVSGRKIGDRVQKIQRRKATET